jgi:serine/threonine-protein kinase RsbT
VGGHGGLHEVRIPVATDADIVQARQSGRAMAARAGCTTTDLTAVATAISEVARNIVNYAGEGEIEVCLVNRRDRLGVRITARDRGPGIADIEQALEDGFTTGSGLGLGLPGARRLMDEFSISSEPGKGTTVVMHKWSRSDSSRV